MTMTFEENSRRLMDLLPALYRVADANPTADDGFLNTLMGLIGQQVEELEHDLEDLYDDLFIETCAPWVVPYIGELVGVLPAREIDGDSLTTRSQVANVIALRRRKGTADVVEELAEAITGWASRVVEMYTILAATQNLNHLRPQTTTISLRSSPAAAIDDAPLSLELIDSAFDSHMHTIDVRWIRSRRGRHAPQNLGVFLWPEADLRFEDVDARQLDDRRFRFHPLGIDTNLMTRRQSNSEIGDAAGIGEVPWPISRRLLHVDMGAESPADAIARGLYGAEASLVVETAEGEVDAEDVLVCALGDVANGSGDWEHVDDVESDQIAVDPQLGRIALGDGLTGPVTVSFTQTLTGPIGGGYSRTSPFTVDDDHQVVQRGGGAPAHQTLQDAIDALGGAGGLIELVDSRTYAESPTITLDAGATIHLASAESTRPAITAVDGIRVECDDDASLILDGLLIAGPVIVVGRPASVTIRHCTLVPGHQLAPDLTPAQPGAPSIIIDGETDVTPELIVERSIVGPILAAAECTVHITDSIVEGGEEQPDSPQSQLVAISIDLETVPDLGTGPNEIMILVSGAPPVVVDVGEADSIVELQQAIDAAGPDPDIAAGIRNNRILVGSQNDLSIRNGGPDDATADTLGFTAGARFAVVGTQEADVAVELGELALRTRPSQVHQLRIDAAPGSIDEAATLLQDAIRDIDDDPRFTDALVFTSAGRLVVVPGAPEERWAFEQSSVADDTARRLGFTATRPAIASDGYGATGPTIELERVTVMGSVRANVAELVSDSIVAGPIVVDRGQEGCVRFSYITPGSVTPRRYRCVPNHDCTPQLAIRSRHFGDRRYGELVPTESMIPVRFGSSLGDEMGAFSSFGHRQREQTLLFNLDEFMRFSMEAGLLDGRTTSGG